MPARSIYRRYGKDVTTCQIFLHLATSFHIAKHLIRGYQPTHFIHQALELWSGQPWVSCLIFVKELLFLFVYKYVFPRKSAKTSQRCSTDNLKIFPAISRHHLICQENTVLRRAALPSPRILRNNVSPG